MSKRQIKQEGDPACHRLSLGKEIVVIKVGSAVLAERPGDLDTAILNRLARLIATWMERGRRVVLVSSGAIAAGRAVFDRARGPRSLPEKQALAAMGQSRLMHAYTRAFGKCGLHVAQILLTRDDMDDRRRYLNARHTIERLMDIGVVPIVNENDTTATEEIEFGDNDLLSAIVAIKIQASALIILTTVDGLLSRGPSGRRDAVLLPRVERVTAEIEALADRAVTSLGRGGMQTKIAAAETATAAGITTVLANGRNPDVLRLLREDSVRGTLFLPVTDRSMSRRDQWILSARSGRNRRLVLDEGACLALIQGKKSLLAAGVREVAGEFEQGDVVDIVDPAGRVIACGLANYSAGEVDRIKGLRSGRIAAVLGRKPYDEVVHRDNLIMLNSDSND